MNQTQPLQNRRRHHSAHNGTPRRSNTYNLLDEMKRTGEKQLQYTRIIKEIEKH